MRRRSTLVILLTCFAVFAQCEPPKASIAPEVQSVLDAIQAGPLRQDLTYIASDALEGRDSPSHGLDLAADYIAKQFRGAGLEPGAGGSYFQNASMQVEEADLANFELKLSAGDRQFVAVPKDAFLRVADAVNLHSAPVFKLDASNESLLQHLTASDLNGKVVVMDVDARFRPRLRAVNRVLREAKPALLIFIDKSGASTREARPRRLVDASIKNAASAPATSRVTLSGEAAARFYGALKAGADGATADVNIAAPHRTPATLRNVIGVLRGSDPALRDTYVLLTAHYDHLGVRSGGTGDRIYNGANDDGSGTVSVVEVARALAHLPKHPRRSIVFMTFFGEEEGLIGSEYYVHHPVFPLSKTVADLNLEQVGRTDSTEGRQVSNASLTGFDYSSLTGFVQSAGESTGIKIYKNPMGSDNYFDASDNFSFAQEGIPAETLCVAFDYSDYHAVGDEWQKIDYDNMAKVDRAIALATLLMADSEKPVEWNESNAKTAPFVKAAKQRDVE